MSQTILVHAHRGGLTGGEGLLDLFEFLFDARGGLGVRFDGGRRSLVQGHRDRDRGRDVRRPANDAEDCAPGNSLWRRVRGGRSGVVIGAGHGCS